ncbi:MAG: helical backbone metal receptor [Caldimonas sp.]
MTAQTQRTPRIASLVPSLTELVFALGLGDCLVARTGYCIHPAGRVASVARIGGTKEVNLAKLRRLAPTHLLVNRDENRRETIDSISAWGADAPEIVVTHPMAPDDNLELVDQFVRVFAGSPGLTERATELRRDLVAELAATTAAGRRERRVLYLIWHDPWMTVARDTYLSRMLDRIAWRTWPDQVGGFVGAARYPVLTGAEPWLAEVEQVLLSSEPFAFQDRHADEARALCPQATVRRVDGELLSWYGSRAVLGLRYLRELAADDNAHAARAD